MRYGKPALAFDEQLDVLRQRGLIVHDPVRAGRWLEHVSHYRLSACFLPFKDGERFRAGTDVNASAGMYIFDRKLRLNVVDAIERVEVALRTAVTYQSAQRAPQVIWNAPSGGCQHVFSWLRRPT